MIPRLAAALLGVALLAPVARAQSPGAQARPGRPFEYTVPEVQSAAPAPSPSQHPAAPLVGAQIERLLRAQGLREAGRFDAAHDMLAALLAEAPHHPLVLAEMARLEADRKQWGAIERLARGERVATRDSLLLGQELVTALERLGHARDAAQIALEVWLASPAAGEWVEPALIRLDAADPRAVREVLGRGAPARLGHVALVRLAARLLWKHGEGPEALRLLADADALKPSTPARWGFAEELLFAATPRDTSGAVDALVELAADRALDAAYRLPAARRAWEISGRRRDGHEGALRVARALADLPPAAWAPDLLVGIVHALREAGDTGDVRALLDRLGERRDAVPGLKLEAALNELHDGPTPKALATLEQAAHGSVEGVFRYAEALFFAGMPDSAAALYRLVSNDPAGPYTGAALERLFLIEDAEPRDALPAFGRLAFASWRGDRARSLALADSLYHGLARGALWAQAALTLAAEHERGGDPAAALGPLIAVGDSLPGDRLAPLALQRAGDLYHLRLQDDAKALERYETCLTRYPRAWNASEVRRVVETIRRERRF